MLKLRIERMFSRGKAQKLAEGFRQNDRRDMFFLYPCGGISLTTSRLRRTPPKNYMIIFKRRAMGFLYPPPVQAPRPPWKEGQFFPCGLFLIPSVAERQPPLERWADMAFF